jgi:putative Mn2+ efflux pump MntP
MVAALLLVAVSLGLSNLAASIGIGVGGVDRRTRLRVGIIFGAFEAAMPAVGLLIGHGLAASLGHAANWLAAGLLILVGGAGVVGGIRGRSSAGTQSPTVSADASVAGSPPSDGSPARPGSVSPSPDRPCSARRPGPVSAAPDRPSSGSRPGIVQLLVSGFALSLDNLVAGFALGSYQVGVLAGVVVFGVISAGMSLAGLEFGARIGSRAGTAGRIIGGIVLAGVGVTIGLGALG